MQPASCQHAALRAASSELPRLGPRSDSLAIRLPQCDLIAVYRPPLALIRRSAASVLLALSLAFLAACNPDSWRPVTLAQRAERRLDFVAHVDERDTMVADFEAFLRDPQPPPDPDRAMTWRDLRVLLNSWREPHDQETDREFRIVLQRTEEKGADMVIIPVRGDQFPVRVLYFRDETFFLVDQVQERHMLFRCLLPDREVIAAGSRLPWNPRINSSTDEDQETIRVYAFWGYDSPDRSTRMNRQHLAQCLNQFADNSHRLRRKLGDPELERVQQVHDLFFQVTR